MKRVNYFGLVLHLHRKVIARHEIYHVVFKEEKVDSHYYY